MTITDQINQFAESTGSDPIAVEMLANMVASRLAKWTGSTDAAIEAARDLAILNAAVDDSRRATKRMAIITHTQSTAFAATVREMVA